MPEVLAVEIYHDGLRRLIVQVQARAQLAEHRVAHAAGAVIGVGGAQQDGGILRIGAVFKEGIIKGIRAEGLAGKERQGLLTQRP